MTSKQVEEKLTELVHREPFSPFVVELNNGDSIDVTRPPAFNEASAVFFGADGGLVEFWFRNVRNIKPMKSGAIA